eukprot:m.69707 g.69707  ORF g.69707 m.69707 type:complete len:540 (+) comp14265_c2_seq1:97-1716(+)
MAPVGPPDRCHAVLITFFVCGAAMLFPYNSFITAVDFFTQRYPGKKPEFVLSMVYMYVTAAMMAVNVFLGVGRFHLITRIRFGYAVFCLSLAAIPISESMVVSGTITRDSAFVVTVLSVALTGLGSGVQQSSFYGYAGMITHEFSLALMAGESLAGVIVSANRLVTMGFYGTDEDETRNSTFVFFYISIVFVVVCTALHEAIQRSAFSRYYVSKLAVMGSDDMELKSGESAGSISTSASSRSQAARTRGANGWGEGEAAGDEFGDEFAGAEARLLGDDGSNSKKKGKARTGQSSLSARHRSGALGGSRETDLDVDVNPAAVEAAPAGAVGADEDWEDDDDAAGGRGVASADAGAAADVAAAAVPSSSLQAYATVTRHIWPSLVAVFINYATTLAVFPGIMTEITSSRLGSWMPVALITVFNLCDFLGKALPVWPVPWQQISWTAPRIIGAACARLVFIPLVIFCAAPASNPIIHSDAAAFIICILFGITNAYVGSVCMALGPTIAQPAHKEIAGNVMSLALLGGLTFGASLALGLVEAV